MNICAIVCEYNPFHNGHRYLIDECRRVLGADSAIVCFMSGDFVQRGEAALMLKHDRARAAVAGGADLEDFFELFDEEIEADVNTVNGWVMIELDRLPKEGDSFNYESKHKLFHVKVIKADSRRALMTRIKVEDKPEEDDERQRKL